MRNGHVLFPNESKLKIKTWNKDDVKIITIKTSLRHISYISWKETYELYKGEILQNYGNSIESVWQWTKYEVYGIHEGKYQDYLFRINYKLLQSVKRCIRLDRIRRWKDNKMWKINSHILESGVKLEDQHVRINCELFPKLVFK